MVLLSRCIDSFEVRPLGNVKRTTFLLGSAGMLILILDGKTAVSGVQDGLELCLQTLIPSLFPFFVLSALVTSSLTGISFVQLRWFSRLCRMPAGSESLLLVGILGGYPVGAGNIAAEYHSGHLSLTDAQRMSIFCNNAGPSFLFGILGPLFPHTGWIWGMWGIQIVSTVITGILLPGGSEATSAPQGRHDSVADALSRGIKNIALVCGWVVLFRLLLTFLDRWLLWLLPESVRTLITGILELSNGCLSLSAIECVEFRFILAGIILSLGGICVWMQTQAVFPELPLSNYISGRILHCLICFALSSLSLLILIGHRKLMLLLLAIMGLSMVLPVLFFRKRKKAVAF